MVVEIWRRPGAGLPVCYTRGEQPKFINSEGALVPVEESPVIKSINFYETGAFAGKAFRGPCFVIQFEESNLRRIIPATDIKDIGYDVPEKVEPKIPALEA